MRSRARAAAVGLILALSCAALGAPPERRPPTSDEVQRALDDVLAEPGQQEALRTSHLEAGGADALYSGTRGLISSVMRWMQRKVRDNPIASRLVVLGSALLLVPLIWHIVWSLRLAFRRVVRTGEASAQGDDPAARRKRSAELRAEAQAHAQAGRLREAARSLLLAFLALLDERQALAVAGSWTNREVLARLQVSPPVRARLRRFVEAADAACYGLQGPTRDALAEGEALLLELERGLEGRAP